MTANELGMLAAMLTVSVVVFALITVFLQRVRMTRRLRLATGGSVGTGVDARMAAGVRSSASRLATALGSLMPLNEEDREKIAVGLERAALRSENAVSVVLGIKFACILVGLLVGLAVLPPTWPGLLGWGIGVVGGLLGGVMLNLLPELAVTRVAAARFRRIHAGLADAFDLMIVCLESGLTFDRALRRTVDNLKTFQPDLARELGQASLDMSVHGRTRADALGRLAARLDSQDFKDLAVTVSQSERHGTPLADALRKLAGSMRVQSVARMQEKMGRLPTLLIVPSIAFVLPGILVIVGGPAFVQMTTSLGNVGS